jgi:hypothetical protein
MTKADAFWRALDDLSPEDRESIGEAAGAMLDECADNAQAAVRDTGDRYNVGMIERTRLGYEAACAVRAARWRP